MTNSETRGCDVTAAEHAQRRILVWVLLINATMFVVEFIAGWIAQSTGLLADSLDMLSDAAVYGVGLYAVGKSALHKNRTAAICGIVELLLAIMVLGEVFRRFIVGSNPEGSWMMAVGTLALCANAGALLLLAKQRQGEIHMRAMWIATSNDVLINLGVIVSGGLVLLLDSRLPDLFIGVAVSVFVSRGAIRILRETRASQVVP